MLFGKIAVTAGLKGAECKKTTEEMLEGRVQIEEASAWAGWWRGGGEKWWVCHSGPGDRLDMG